MGIDALLQIPWLSAILSSVIWLGKAIWELFGRAAKNVALWFATAVPLVLAWASQRVAHWVVVIGLWLAAVQAVWEVARYLLAQLVAVIIPSELVDIGGQWLFWLWDDPIQLRTAWALLSRMPGPVLSAYSLRVLWARFKWLVWTTKR